MLTSLRPAEGQWVAAVLQALRRKDWAEATGTRARAFIEAETCGYRLLYRFDRNRLRVALLARVNDSRPREMPRLRVKNKGD
jgi:hypothetical protein